MIINRQSLLELAPIKDMLSHKASNGDVSYGISEAGYDIRIKQTVVFSPKLGRKGITIFESEIPDDADDFVSWKGEDGSGYQFGRFVLASAIEEFQMPNNLVGIVHDKSTWARRGLSVFNTVIEPGWNGFLTLELVYHGNTRLVIPAGSGIAQVVFHQTSDEAAYTGKYQDQEDKPVEARSS